MKDMNTINIIGRLTRDPEVRYGSSGSAVMTFTIANNRPKKEGDRWTDEAHFFDVKYFGKSAEGIKPYLAKGKQVAVCGSLHQDRWEKDGQKQSRVAIYADEVQLIGSQSQQNDNQSGYQQNAQQYNQQSRQQYQQNVPPQVQSVQNTFGGEFAEDIPF